jgi:hypothetical protein
MSSLRNSRFARILGVFLVAAVLLPLSPWAAPKAHADEQLRRVLLFTVADESSSGMPGLAELASDAVQMAVDSAQAMECTEFSRTSPLVRRAADEGRILPTQVETGPLSPSDAVMIGREIGVDTVLMASVQSYRTTANPRSVEVIVAGQAYDVKPNFNAETGVAAGKPSVAQAFGVVGISRKVPGYSGSDRPLAREALDDAAYRIAKVLGGASVNEVSGPKPTPKKSNSAWKWLAIAAVVGGVIWAISSSSGDDDSSAGALPPTPLPLQVEGTDTIRLSWNPPTGTTVPVLQYQIQRSVDSGAYAYFGMGASSDNIRGTTTFPDFDVSSGQSFRYRIRAVYEDLSVSMFVDFGGVTL